MRDGSHTPPTALVEAAVTATLRLCARLLRRDTYDELIAVLGPVAERRGPLPPPCAAAAIVLLHALLEAGGAAQV